MSSHGDKEVKEKTNDRQMENNYNKQFYNLFKGRTDKVGLATTKSTDVANENEILNHVTNHLNGTCRLGFYNLLQDGTSPWAVIEFEDHGKDGDPTNPEELTKSFIEHLATVNIPVYAERSKQPEGKSYHLWIFFNQPVSAEKVHKTFKKFVRDVMGVDTEVFPKGYNPTTLGNFVWLPLFGGTDIFGLGINEGRTVFIDADKDQWEYLKNIQRIDETDLDRLIDKYQLKLTDDINRQYEKPTADLEKVRECSFMKHCEKNADRLPEPLWYAWITNAIRCVGGRDYVHKFSSKYPGYSKTETEQKIAHAINNTGPMKHDTIRELRFECDCPDELAAPVSRSYYVDIPEEIERIKSMTDEKEKLEATKRIIRYWSKLKPIDQDHWKRFIKSELGLTNQVFEEKFEERTTPAIGEGDNLQQILSICTSRRLPDENLGEVVYEWMQVNGYKFYRDKSMQHYLYGDKKLYVVNGNDEFKAFLYELTGISTVTQRGKVILDVVKNLIQLNGKLIDCDTWVYTDHDKHTLYVSMNDENQRLLKISPTGIETVDNGSNTDEVLLNPSEKISEIEYIPMTEAERKVALHKLRTMVVDYLACSESDKIFCIAWTIGIFLIDYVRTKPHLRFEGVSSSGKSTGMDLISYLIYGSDQKKIGTIASNYSDGAQNPLVLLDNIEVQNLNRELIDFILTAVTGITKEKRSGGTDIGIVQEKTKCFICTTGVENIRKNELISRTYVVQFDRRKYSSRYNDSDLLKIKKNRNIMLSAIFQVISEVLDDIADGTWDDVKVWIDYRYPSSTKDRTNSYLTLMALIANKLLRDWGFGMEIDTLVNRWMQTQQEDAADTGVDTDPVVMYLSYILNDAKKYDGNNGFWEYDISMPQKDIFKNTYTMTGQAKELLASFQTACRKKGIKCEYKNAKQLGRRIKDSEQVLKEAGWSVTMTRASNNSNLYVLKYAA